MHYALALAYRSIEPPFIEPSSYASGSAQIPMPTILCSRMYVSGLMLLYCSKDDGGVLTLATLHAPLYVAGMTSCTVLASIQLSLSTLHVTKSIACRDHILSFHHII